MPRQWTEEQRKAAGARLSARNTDKIQLFPEAIKWMEDNGYLVTLNEIRDARTKYETYRAQLDNRYASLSIEKINEKLAKNKAILVKLEAEIRHRQNGQSSV